LSLHLDFHLRLVIGDGTALRSALYTPKLPAITTNEQIVRYASATFVASLADASVKAAVSNATQGLPVPHSADFSPTTL